MIIPADHVEIFLDIKRETDKALLVSDGDQDVWLPKSQIVFDEEIILAGAGVVVAPEWLLKTKGLI